VAGGHGLGVRRRVGGPGRRVAGHGGAGHAGEEAGKIKTEKLAEVVSF